MGMKPRQLTSEKDSRFAKFPTTNRESPHILKVVVREPLAAYLQVLLRLLVVMKIAKDRLDDPVTSAGPL